MLLFVPRCSTLDVNLVTRLNMSQDSESVTAPHECIEFQKGIMQYALSWKLTRWCMNSVLASDMHAKKWFKVQQALHLWQVATTA
jgi:hypothetical protein